MRYSEESKQYHISQIRRILVMKPDASIRETQEILTAQKRPLDLDKDYVNKLINKIRKERTRRADRYLISEKLALIEDKLDESDWILWRMVNSSSSNNSERISALREIRQNNTKMLEILINSGLFEKQTQPKTLEDLLREDDEKNS